MSYPRRSPLTSAYLLVLVATYLLVTYVLSAAAAERLLEGISTTPHQLAHDPLGSMFGSTLIADTSGPLVDTILTTAFGIGLCMAVLERRAGSWRAAGIFLSGHVVGTLVACAVTVSAVHSGRYPEGVAHELDYGVSYGAIAVSAALTPLLPRLLRVPWAAFMVLYPFTDAQWFGDVPDFTTIGHVTGALTGLTLGFAALRVRSTAKSGTRAGTTGTDQDLVRAEA